MKISLIVVAFTLFLASPSYAQGIGGPTPDSKLPDKFTQQILNQFKSTLPFKDTEDWGLVQRGFVTTVQDGKLRNPTGQVVADLNANAFLEKVAPPTVNPSLWRNAQLLEKNGLFKVTDTIYQIRGFSISNMTIIVGKTGYIIVDPGFEAEAYTGMQLVYQTLGHKPIVGILYTHSHSDHYGGVRGIISDEDVKHRNVPVIAPVGFIKAIQSESIIAGPAMIRRAAYQFGMPLSLANTGVVNLGIGPSVQTVSASPNTPPPASGTPHGRLPIVPTHEITHTGETLSIDGVKFEFQLALNTEAPAELHFYLPDFKALCLAENANGTLHNALPARGALVRDLKAWSNALTEALTLYGDRTEVLFTSHFWPHWGRAKIVNYLSNHRDAYEYLHDQSVRLMNNGLTGPEIARTIQYPSTLASKWYNREYYGTLSHNSRAVYQRYMGFYDGNPANLDPLTPTEAAHDYVNALGGGKRVLVLAQQSVHAGDYRWAVELLNRLVFAEPENRTARLTLADIYEQLGYRAESATWRNGYLVAALELRKGSGPAHHAPPFAGLVNLPTDLFLDAAAVRLVPDRAKDITLRFTLVDPGTGESTIVDVRNAVLVHYTAQTPASNAPILRLDAKQFYEALEQPENSQLDAEGQQTLARFSGLFEGPLLNFPIVTP